MAAANFCCVAPSSDDSIFMKLSCIFFASEASRRSSAAGGLADSPSAKTGSAVAMAAIAQDNILFMRHVIGNFCAPLNNIRRAGFLRNFLRRARDFGGEKGVDRIFPPHNIKNKKNGTLRVGGLLPAFFVSAQRSSEYARTIYLKEKTMSNSSEILAILEYMEKEKQISRADMIESIASAIRNAASKGAQAGYNLKIDINPKTGEIGRAHV